jgi:hypothetical protein
MTAMFSLAQIEPTNHKPTHDHLITPHFPHGAVAMPVTQGGGMLRTTAEGSPEQVHLRSDMGNKQPRWPHFSEH